MSLSVPVLVNGACAVLKGHCTKSNGGLYYQNYFEFEGAVEYLLHHPVEYMQMCANARAYIDENYDWNVIMERFSEVIEQVSGTTTKRDSV
jgi:glycosyltransferase involved in cell wall biosynthesis